MHNFQKLSRAEMKNVTGGDVSMPVGCYVSCTDPSNHPVNSGVFTIASCDPNYAAAVCMGSYVDWCQCYNMPGPPGEE